MHRLSSGDIGPGANRIWLAWPKGMRANDLNFYCIFERIGHKAKG